MTSHVTRIKTRKVHLLREVVHYNLPFVSFESVWNVNSKHYRRDTGRRAADLQPRRRHSKDTDASDDVGDQSVGEEVNERHREGSSSHRLAFDVAQLWKRKRRAMSG